MSKRTSFGGGNMKFDQSTSCEHSDEGVCLQCAQEIHDKLNQKPTRVTVDIAASDCYGAAPSDMQSARVGSIWTVEGRQFSVAKVRHLANGGIELVMQPYGRYKSTQVTIDHEGKYR